MPLPTPDGVQFVTEPAGLDFNAVLAVAAARGADATLLAEVLPMAEAAIINAMTEEGESDAE